ncbi:MAG: phosphodiester glycosidase family protein [Acidobacteriota bacterium]
MKKYLLLILVLLSFMELRAQYKLDTLLSYKAGPGVTYTKMRVESIPLNVDMMVVDLKNPFIKVESVKANEKLDGREALSSMIKRRNVPQHNVVGGVNSDFFDMSNGRPINIQIENGEILRGPIGLSTVGFDVDNKPMLGRVNFGGQLILKDTTVTVSGVNQGRNSNQMILFNSFNGQSTGTNSYGTEARIHPLGMWLANDTVKCVVDTVVSGVGNMALTEGHAVLSGHGVMDAILKGRVKAADTIKVNLGITPGLKKLKEMLGGYPKIVYNGKNWADQGYLEEGGPDHTYQSEPRTAIGFSQDSTKMYLFIVDGRSDQSAGLTLPKLADLMIQEGVYLGMNFDGGGSSEMIVRNSIMNSPSDGGERTLSNALIVVSTAPIEALNSITILPQKKAVFRDDKVTFSAIGSDKYFNAVTLDPAKVTYSCDAKIGTIDNKGLFTASKLNGGQGYVYVSYDNVKDSALVTLKPIVKISLIPNNFTTDTLRSVRLSLKAYDSQNAVRSIPVSEIKWTLSDSLLGTLDALGSFRAKKEGKGSIIAEYQGIIDTVEVSVVVGKDVKVINEMENVEEWTISGSAVDMANTKLSVVQDLKSSGTGSLKVDYTFTYDGLQDNIIYLDPKKPIEVYGVPDTLFIDGRVDTAVNHRVYLVLMNDNGDLFRANPSNGMNSAGVFGRVDIPARASQVITPGAFFIFPIKVQEIEIRLGSSKETGKTYKGTLYLDNLRARYPLQTTGVEESASSLRPDKFALMQNYPNPFNPATVIEFTTKELSHVSLRVYDMLGREVEVLLDKELPSGSHRVNFSAQGLSSGVYFYRLQSGSMVEVKKMMLVR